MLREMVPVDVLRCYAPEDWKKAIIAEFNRHPARSKEDAKISFLKYVSHWQTFGSAFFEVKVSGFVLHFTSMNILWSDI